MITWIVQNNASIIELLLNLNNFNDKREFRAYDIKVYNKNIRSFGYLDSTYFKSMPFDNKKKCIL